MGASYWEWAIIERSSKDAGWGVPPNLGVLVAFDSGGADGIRVWIELIRISRVSVNHSGRRDVRNLSCSYGGIEGVDPGGGDVGGRERFARIRVLGCPGCQREERDE